MTCRFVRRDEPPGPRERRAPATAAIAPTTSSGSCRARKRRSRSSPPTLPGELTPIRHDSVPTIRRTRCSEATTERRRIESRSPGKLKCEPLAAVGRLGVEEDEPDRLLLACRPRARRCRSPRRRRRRRGARAPRAPSPRRPRPRRRRARSISSGGHAELLDLDLVRVGDDRHREHVARARDRREPGGDEPARARLRRRRACSPRSRQRSSTISSTDRRPSERGSGSSRSRERRLERAPALLGRRARRRGRRGSRSRGRRSSPRPRPRRRPPPASACATADSPGPKKRSVRRSGGVAAVEHRPHGFDLERPRPEPLQLARRARQDDDRRPVRVDDEAGRRAGEPERRSRPRARSPACARRPRSPRTGASAARRPRGRQPSICASSSSSTCSARPATLRDELDRPVVVRRPEPTRARDEIGRGERLAQRRLELVGVVADDLDPRRLEPEREQRASEERAVQVGPVAAHELAARDDDHRPRAACPGLNWRRRRRSSSPSRRRPAP